MPLLLSSYQRLCLFSVFFFLFVCLFLFFTSHSNGSYTNRTMCKTKFHREKLMLNV